MGSFFRLGGCRLRTFESDGRPCAPVGDVDLSGDSLACL